MSVTINQRGSANYSHGSVNSMNVYGAPKRFVLADGVSVITVFAEVKDAYGNPISGSFPIISCSGSGNTIVQPGVSDSNGITSGTLSSTVSEAKTITVTLGIIVKHINVDFCNSACNFDSVDHPPLLPPVSAVNIPSNFKAGDYDFGYTVISHRGETTLSSPRTVTLSTFDKLSNPVIAPILSSNSSNSNFSAGVYYVGYSYVTATGGETILSPISSITLTNGHSINCAQVSSPSIINPSGNSVVVYVRWYVSAWADDSNAPMYLVAATNGTAGATTIYRPFKTNDYAKLVPLTNTSGFVQSVAMDDLRSFLVALSSNAIGVRYYIAQSPGSSQVRLLRAGACFDISSATSVNSDIWSNEANGAPIIIYSEPTCGGTVVPDFPPNDNTTKIVGVPTIISGTTSGTTTMTVASAFQIAGLDLSVPDAIIVFPYDNEVGLTFDSATNGVNTYDLTLPAILYSGNTYIKSTVALAPIVTNGHFTITLGGSPPAPDVQINSSGGGGDTSEWQAYVRGMFCAIHPSNVDQVWFGSAQAYIFSQVGIIISVVVPSGASGGPLILFNGEGNSGSSAHGYDNSSNNFGDVIVAGTFTPTNSHIHPVSNDIDIIANNIDYNIQIQVTAVIPACQNVPDPNGGSTVSANLANYAPTVASDGGVSDTITQPPATADLDFNNPSVWGTTTGKIATKVVGLNRSLNITAGSNMISKILNVDADRFSPIKSTISLGQPNQTANNSAQNTTTVVPKDGFGNFPDTTGHFSAASLAVTTAGPNTGIIANQTGPDVSGQFHFDLKITTAGIYLVSLVANRGILVPVKIGEFLITATSGTYNDSGYGVSSEFNNANGSDKFTITVTSVDANSNVVSNVAIIVNVTGTGNIITPSTSGVTDGDGQFICYLASTVAETKTITITANGVSVNGPTTRVFH